MSTPDHAYPIARPCVKDPRFTFGLMLDMSEVLVKHGYPTLTGHDLVRLQQALFKMIYVVDESDIHPVLRIEPK